MALKTYWQKRKFSRTPEPRGQEETSTQNRFVVQKHQARQLHYDFRLELPDVPKGKRVVLKSWAVPKGPPVKAGERRLAVATEDHPVTYLNFKGLIPEGYGAGTVEIWDSGTFDLALYSKRELKFTLYGDRLKGGYAMVLFRPPKNWLLLKEKE